MTVKGYIDRKAFREPIMAELRAKGLLKKFVTRTIQVKIMDADGKEHLIDSPTAVMEDADEPPGGWDAYFNDDHPICNIKCQMCGEMVPEVRPFGPNHESICEKCAEKDPEMTELRWRELNPNG